MSPPVLPIGWYKRQMFIENRLEDRNEQIVVFRKIR